VTLRVASAPGPLPTRDAWPVDDAARSEPTPGSDAPSPEPAPEPAPTAPTAAAAPTAESARPSGPVETARGANRSTEGAPAPGASDDVGGGPDVIRLVLPAEPDYGRIARIAASSLALRLGLSFTEIEDLRIAVDETVILLLRPEGDIGDITLEFTVEPHALVIDAVTTAGTAQHWFDVGALSRFDEIVRDTVDEHEVDEAARHVHLVKRF